MWNCIQESIQELQKSLYALEISCKILTNLTLKKCYSLVEEMIVCWLIDYTSVFLFKCNVNSINQENDFLNHRFVSSKDARDKNLEIISTKILGMHLAGCCYAPPALFHHEINSFHKDLKTDFFQSILSLCFFQTTSRKKLFYFKMYHFNWSFFYFEVWKKISMYLRDYNVWQNSVLKL